jgi:zona occludens toxin
MAISAYVGQPGMGKSYALVSQVIVPAVMAGRRVLSNIEGLDPQKVHDYCAAKSNGTADLGEVVIFHGADAQQSGFFPKLAPAGSANMFVDGDFTVKPGDLLVIDEWHQYFPNRGGQPNPDLGPFLMGHRHLVAENGQSTDVAIATQLLTHLHRDYRGAVERNFKFKKLSTVGFKKGYSWTAYSGHLQSKDSQYAFGTDVYRKEIFDLYSSYSGGSGLETSTDSRTTIYGPMWAVAAGLALIFVIGGLWYSYRFFTGDGLGGDKPSTVAGPAGGRRVGGNPAIPTPTRASAGRISGFYTGARGVRIVVVWPDGSVRVVGPDGFTFDGDRPVEGVIDGKRVVASDTLEEAFNGGSVLPAVLPTS